MDVSLRDSTKANNLNRERKIVLKLLEILRNSTKDQISMLSCKDRLDPPDKLGLNSRNSTESAVFKQFSSSFQNVRKFSTHPLNKFFTQILDALVKRLSCTEWMSRTSPQSILQTLTCLRLLVRDLAYQQMFFDLGAVKTLSQNLQAFTQDYFDDEKGELMVDILKEMTNICQKLPTDDKKREWLVACGVQKPLVMLLSSMDIVVLHCSLLALIGLSQSEKARITIGELNCIEILLRVIEAYDVASKRLAANLLRILCSDINTRQQVKLYQGIRICLSLLDSDDIELLWYLVWIIVQLSQDADSSDEIRLLGGIPLLLSLIHKDRQYHTGENILVVSAGSTKSTSDPATVKINEVLSLKSATCTALAELVLNDTNAQQVVQANGVYLLSCLILPNEKDGQRDFNKEEIENLQKNAFRALRFLFSMEKNRQLFKMLFPPGIFERFIDVGHYVRDLNDYGPLVNQINSLSSDEVSVIVSNIEKTNKRRMPTRTVGTYVVLEQLGSGAFGTVYKVRKKNGDGTFCAMKEIPLTNSNFGKTINKEKEKSSGSLINELKIMKKQLNHPNLVKYLKAFQQTEKLYVVMDLIEGATLTEHIKSLEEKKERFSEERIWNIFIQIILGLRYLHKEKHIIHRDLTPNNVMLGNNDKVTITDLGLARQKLPEASELTSVVGTMLYWCPEILQHRPYGEKADVWAAGCLLYQMATLRPPFYSSNFLQLATKIAKADYEPIADELYSHKLQETVQRCITSNPDQRPDVVEVGAIISELMMKYIDTLRAGEGNLQKKLQRERKRTQKHYEEANKNMQNYHRLFWANQERSEKYCNLASSSGSSDTTFRDSSDASDKTFELLDDYKEDNPCRELNFEEGNVRCPLITGAESNTSSNKDVIARNNLTKTKIGQNVFSGDKKSDTNLFSFSSPPNLRDKALDQQLMLEITCRGESKSGLSNSNSTALHEAHNSRDSSKRRTQSSSSVEMRRHQSGGQPNARPPTAATLTISPRKVRQISDPILQILNQIHKILFITQLPPPLSTNPNRQIVEKFKKALFSRQTTSLNLKNEIKKVLEGSKDLIDFNFGFYQPTQLPTQKYQGDVMEGFNHGTGVSYELVQGVIEDVLMENGYYDMNSTIKHHPVRLGLDDGGNGK